MMYGWVWRHTPGPVTVKVLIWTVAVLAVLTVCFVWVFPALAPHVPFNDTTVGD